MSVLVPEHIAISLHAASGCIIGKPTIHNEDLP